MITRESVESAFDTFHKSQHPAYNDRDIKIIMAVIEDKFDVKLSVEECKSLWSWYSDEFYAASWLSVSRSEIIDAFETFIKKYGSLRVSDNEEQGIYKIQKEASSR